MVKGLCFYFDVCISRRVRAPGRLACSRIYMNADYPSFKEAVRAFFLDAGISTPPVTACLAVAGPVSNNSVEFTNKKEWSIVGDDIASHFGIRHVRLINDFMAVGYGLLTLNESKECVTLQVRKILSYFNKDVLIFSFRQETKFRDSLLLASEQALDWENAS